MEDIHACADAVEKFWNHGACRYVISEDFKLHWYESAFAIVYGFGQGVRKAAPPYQPYELFCCFIRYCMTQS